MKKVSVSLMLVFISLFFTLFAQKATVLGKVEYKKQPIYGSIVINQVKGNNLVPVDTVVIDEKGNYKTTLEIQQPTLFVVKFIPSQNEITYWFVVPKEKVVLDYEVDVYPILTNVKGSKNMEVFKGFVEKNKNIELLNREYPTADDIRKKEIEKEFIELYPKTQNDIKEYILENKKVLMSAFIVTCFDQEFAKYVSLYESVRDALINDYPNDQYVKNIDERLKKTIFEGSMAPDIVMDSPDGEKLKLSDLRGKVVLIDFWASWCGPCRRENPNVVKLYEKYKDKGFEIFSVSLDKDKSAWIKAIKDDNLKWKNHVSDLKYWSSATAKLYGVSSIPSTVLIDKEGRVIAKNLRGRELEIKMKEIFGE